MSFFSFLKKAPTDLSPSDFKTQMEADSNAVLIDVRTAEECKGGIIGNAQHLDFFAPNFRDKLDSLPKDKNYYVYCHSGNRSGQAVRALNSMGCTAYNLDGGIMRWHY